MKRQGDLWETIISRDNLRTATYKAMRGKRDRFQTQFYIANLEANLNNLAISLRNASFCFGRFHQFVIYDPKERIITAPCFEERIVHHAIMNVCEPHFERWHIADTFACRKGKGRLAALSRVLQYNKKYNWYLKIDIRKFFDSICHIKLMDLLERKL